eukprot:COSAG02_NODE_7121_length_3171_cov_128.512232_1_plen_109_part_00
MLKRQATRAHQSRISQLHRESLQLLLCMRPTSATLARRLPVVFITLLFCPSRIVCNTVRTYSMLFTWRRLWHVRFGWYAYHRFDEVAKLVHLPVVMCLVVMIMRCVLT